MLDAAQSQTEVFTMAIMDGTGHTSFGWDASDSDWVIPMIRRKMAEGYVFWIIEHDRQVRLERVEDLGEHRLVIINEPDAKELFERGKIGIVTDEPDEVTRRRRARSAEEIARNHTVAHRALTGG